MHRRLFTVGLVALVGFSMLGCSKAFTPDTVSGTYILRKVNGADLPSSSTDLGVTTTIINGGAILSPDLSYVFTLNVEIDDGMTVVDETQNDAGTYALIEPDTITFTGEDGIPTTTTLEGNTISVTLDGMTFRFERL